MSALISGTRLSHGTIECNDALVSRRFFVDFLGLGSVRPLPEAQYLWSGGPWSLVCVAIGDQPKRQGPENRFCLRVPTAADVDSAHAAAEREAATYGLHEVGAVSETGGVRSFLIGDRDGNWWEIANTQAADYDAAFLRGDVTG